MIKIKNHKQQNLFDPWGHISPKRRAILDKSWSGLFQREVLPCLPVKKMSASRTNTVVLRSMARLLSFIRGILP